MGVTGDQNARQFDWRPLIESAPAIGRQRQTMVCALLSFDTAVAVWR